MYILYTDVTSQPEHFFEIYWLKGYVHGYQILVLAIHFQYGRFGATEYLSSLNNEREIQ